MAISYARSLTQVLGRRRRARPLPPFAVSLIGVGLSVALVGLGASGVGALRARTWLDKRCGFEVGRHSAGREEGEKVGRGGEVPRWSELGRWDGQRATYSVPSGSLSNCARMGSPLWRVGSKCNSLIHPSKVGVRHLPSMSALNTRTGGRSDGWNAFRDGTHACWAKAAERGPTYGSWRSGNERGRPLRLVIGLLLSFGRLC